MASGNSHVRITADIDLSTVAVRAVQRRIERYAAKFNADTVRQGAEWVQCEPTDENLAYVLDRCVRPARPAEYPAIREAVLRQRAEDV